MEQKSQHVVAEGKREEENGAKKEDAPLEAQAEPKAEKEDAPAKGKAEQRYKYEVNVVMEHMRRRHNLPARSPPRKIIPSLATPPPPAKMTKSQLLRTRANLKKLDQLNNAQRELDEDDVRLQNMAAAASRKVDGEPARRNKCSDLRVRSLYGDPIVTSDLKEHVKKYGKPRFVYAPGAKLDNCSRRILPKPTPKPPTK